MSLTEPHTSKISEMTTQLLKIHFLGIYNKCTTHNLTAVAEGVLEALTAFGNPRDALCQRTIWTE